MGASIKKFLFLVIAFFLLSGCASKIHTVEQNNHVGVATVVGTAGGVALGGVVGGMMGLLASGGTGGVAPFVGLALGATLAGSAGYGLGQTIDN